ncbi:MAG TPA: PKD domain-containing protein, partial [Chryseosolibacter sp.]|nr:PKD domain-containing protein [Chryseosolibacter sp.]
AAGTYTVQVAVQDANGCNTSFEEAVKIYDAPTPAFSVPDGVICTNNEFTFTNETIDNYDNLITYNWYTNGVLTTETRDLHHTFVTHGDYAVKLVTSIPGCSTEITKVIENVGEGPLVSFDYEGLTCEYETIEFENSIIGEIDHLLWDFAGLSQSTESNPSKTFPAGSHNVSLTATGTNGCVTTVSEPITVYSKPIVEFDTESTLLCENTAVKFLDSSSSQDGYVAVWRWTFGDEGTSTEQNPAFNFAMEGERSIELTIENSYGCESSSEITITIEPQPVAEITHGHLCVNTPVNFGASADPLADQWSWTVDNKAYTTETASHTFRTAGVYNALLVVTGSNGCENTAEKSVKIYPALTPGFVAEKNCVDYDASLTDITTSEDELVSRQWQIGNDIYAGNQINYVFTESGLEDVTLTLQTNSGCTYSKVIPVDVAPAPEALFMMSSDIGSPDMPFEFENRSKDATSFSWDFGDGNTSPDESTTHSFDAAGAFNVKLIASNDLGCSDSFSRPVTITVPAPGISVLAVTTTESADNSISIHVVLENEGNTTFENLPVSIDVSGILQLSEIITTKIFPQSRYNLDLQYNIVDDGQLKFICAEAVIEQDLAPANNRNCTSISREVMQFFPVYPNPASGAVNFEWLADEEGRVTITIVSSMGDTVITRAFDSKMGLNAISIPVENLKSGVYMMIIEGGDRKSTQRLLLSN